MENSVSGAQLDLFDGSSTAAPSQPAAETRVDVQALGDAELIDALPQAGLHECLAIVHEIARRRLGSGSGDPSLTASCKATLRPGPSKAPRSMSRASACDASRPPITPRASIASFCSGTTLLLPNPACLRQRAARAGAADPLVTNLLRADDPGVRAAAARCVRTWPRCAPSLIDLLQDLHEDVRLAAACALGRIGNGAARPALLRALRQQPSREVVEAIAGIPDQEVLVLLGRTAETRQDLAGLIREVLDGIDHPLAAKIEARIGR